MNPSDAHRRNYQVTRARTRDGPATTYTSRHLLPPSRLVAPAFVHNDQQARAAQDVQFHPQSVGTEVSQLMLVREERLTREQLLPNFPPPQTFLPYGSLPGSTREQYHVRLDSNSPYNTVGTPQPRTLASSYTAFDQRAYLPQHSLRTICDANDIFWMDLHSNTSAPEFADQPHAHLTTNDMQSPIQSPWPTNSCGGLGQSERRSIAFKDQVHVPSHSAYTGASTVYTRLESAVSASPPDGYPTQSPPPALESYLPFIPSTSAPIQRGLPYQALEHESASALASSWPSVLGSAEQSATPASGPSSSERGEQAGSARRSVRTHHGDVYADYELGTDQVSGRWVCQCGSTFVRDSDWERHAVHSLSHGVGGGFDCSICDISFTRSDAMSRHLRKKHGGLKAQT
jgi:hypothetical protein